MSLWCNAYCTSVIWHNQTLNHKLYVKVPFHVVHTCGDVYSRLHTYVYIPGVRVVCMYWCTCIYLHGWSVISLYRWHDVRGRRAKECMAQLFQSLWRHSVSSRWRGHKKFTLTLQCHTGHNHLGHPESHRGVTDVLQPLWFYSVSLSADRSCESVWHWSAQALPELLFFNLLVACCELSLFGVGFLFDLAVCSCCVGRLNCISAVVLRM